jgi:hypothetical protein
MSLIFALVLIGLPVVGAFYDVTDGELVMRLGANLRRQLPRHRIAARLLPHRSDWSSQIAPRENRGTGLSDRR